MAVESVSALAGPAGEAVGTKPSRRWGPPREGGDGAMFVGDDAVFVVVAAAAAASRW
jgi:hypothetical protein